MLITYNYTILRPHKLIAGTITLCTLYFSMLSCSGPDNRLEQALTLAGSNRPELEKVLRRYSSPEDSLKYRAAVFLIENMPGYGYYEGPALDSFLEYYHLLRSVRLKKQSPDVAVDSINRKYGKFDLSSLHYKEDIRAVDSAYLCKNIEWAFRVWNEQPWGRNVGFRDFCEYILPYRVGNETLADWREMYYEKYNGILDGLRNSDSSDREDPAAAARIITDSLTGPKKIFFTSAAPAALPHIGPVAADSRSGSCRDLVDFALYVCRALGIPCASDYMPFRGDGNVGHEWAAFLGRDSLYCQDMGNPIVNSSKISTLRKLKVYRRTFSVNEELSGLDIQEQDRPDFLKRPCFEDVTPAYAIDFLKTLEVPGTELYRGIRPKTVYLCMSSRFSWVPVAVGKFRWGNAEFEDIDCNTQVMRVASVKDGKVMFLSDPFYIKESGELHFYRAGKELQDITVFRKFSDNQELWLQKRMINGVFEGCNDSTFSKKERLHIIRKLPKRLLVPVRPNKSGPYRYVRYAGPRYGFCNIADMYFYSTDGELLTGRPMGTPGSYGGDKEHDYLSALDGNSSTSFDSKKYYHGWVGLDFGEPKHIGKIVYTPRNRDNHVRPGDEYELFYCDGIWKSAGRVTASSDSILYKGLPAGTLYILNNLSRGKDIRVFSYDNGVQEWDRPKKQ